MRRKGMVRVGAARLLIGCVLFFNVQCALAFLIAPQGYAPGFELSGDVGAGMIRGMGILFLMWNVPYAVALWNPVSRRVSLYEVIAMQAIGFTGESLLLAAFPTGHPVILATVSRFAAFVGIGLAALVAAAVLTHNLSK